MIRRPFFRPIVAVALVLALSTGARVAGAQSPSLEPASAAMPTAAATSAASPTAAAPIGDGVPVGVRPQCPGDVVVWVHGRMFYPAAMSARLQPGNFACKRDARRDGYHDVLDVQAGMGAGPPIVDSVYDAMDGAAHLERPGYGRYTYLLLTGPNDAARNAALLSSVMLTTPSAGTVSIDRRALNVFEIPERAAFWKLPGDKTDYRFALQNYDFGKAHDLLQKACAAAPHPAVCDGNRTGPFLLTYGHPLASLDRANPPYLIVDLHRLNPQGFLHMVALMKQQVKGADIADAHLVQGMHVQLLSTVLDVSDWLPGLVSQVKNITSLVGSK